MGTANDNNHHHRTLPRSLRHKQVLDVAAERPEASFEAIADEVPSATADLVENVLDEYGDPAEPPENSLPDSEPGSVDTEPSADNDASPETVSEADLDTGGESPPTAPDIQPGNGETPADTEPDSHSEEAGSRAADWKSAYSRTLTDRQRELLETIVKHPDATQREIGDLLDVSAATVCTHMSAIEGCDWTHRHEIVPELLDSLPTEPTAESNGHDPPETESTPMETREHELSADVEQLGDRIATLEEHLEADPGAAVDGIRINDPELLHKVIHVCMESETITKDEELQLIKALV